MSSKLDALLRDAEDWSAETRSEVVRLVSENEDLQAFAADKEQLMRSMGELHAQCLELHDSTTQLHNELGRIYVSATQLSASLSRWEIVSSLREIIANLIGSEELAILLIPAVEGDASETPTVLDEFGVEPGWMEARSDDWQRVQNVIETGESFFADEPVDSHSSENDSKTLNACLALRAGEKLTGVVAIFKLLPHKKMLTPSDRDLCQVIASLAGQAIYCSELHGRFERSVA